jgi:hypothetical protein
MRFEVVMVVIIITAVAVWFGGDTSMSGKPTASIIYSEDAGSMHLLNYIALHPKDIIILVLSVYLIDHL